VLLAQTLSHTLRNNDLVARVGGEEFLVVLCDITLQDGFVIAEKIRQNIASCDVNKIQVTVSIGVASSYQSSSSFSDIWKDADAALYQSKHTGRNKTTLSQ
jgi:diguanylate cyclase (GGDEF)-like protein